MEKSRALLVALLAGSIVSAQPAVAGALRSADALPLFSAQAMANGDDLNEEERCLKIDRVRVKVDAFGRPILDAAGEMIRCRPVAGGFPWGVIAGLFVIPLGIFAVGGGGGSGGGGPDSPG